MNAMPPKVPPTIAPVLLPPPPLLLLLLLPSPFPLPPLPPPFPFPLASLRLSVFRPLPELADEGLLPLMQLPPAGPPPPPTVSKLVLPPKPCEEDMSSSICVPSATLAVQLVCCPEPVSIFQADPPGIMPYSAGEVMLLGQLTWRGEHWEGVVGVV